MANVLRLDRSQLSGISKDPEVIKQLEKLISTVNALVLAGGATLADGDYGDVTASGAGTTITIDPLVVTDAKVAAANKDGAAATPSMRTLGTGALQATAGNDARLSDTRTPIMIADPGTTQRVVGDNGTDAVRFGNLEHNSTTKTTTTSSLIASINVSTLIVAVGEGSLPSTVANNMMVFADTSNRLKVVRESGTVVQLDAVEVAQAAGLVSTRRRLNFVSGATVADNAGTDSADVTVTAGGDSITVNGVAVVDANFSTVTPVAPASGLNVVFQKDALSPANISAHILGDGVVTNFLTGTGTYAVPAGTGLTQPQVMTRGLGV